MRKLVFLVALIGALAVPAAGLAKGPITSVICGTACDGGGGGYTGCTQARADHEANIGVAYLDHYLIVSYCKVNGVITSLSIAAHGCTYRLLATCTAGNAWQTGGGVGYGYATFTGQAQWAAYPLFFVANTDTVDLTINWG